MSRIIRVIPCLALIAAGCATEEVAQPVAQEADQRTVAAVQQPVCSDQQPTGSDQQLASADQQQGASQQEVAPQPVYVPQVNTISTVTPVANVKHETYKQVILDGFQPQWVAIQDVRRTRTNDGYERIQVLVKNLTQSPIRTRYRFDWQDANGVVVMDPDHSGWEKLTLIPGDEGTFTSIAPKKDCADFRLRMAVVQ